MQAILPGLALTAILLLASPAAAEVSGPWHVGGQVAGHPFALDCRFEPHGAALGGVCTEQSTGDPNVHSGTTHVLTQGAVNGNQVRWTYRASFLIAKFDVTYVGTLDGSHMTGTVEASGRKGEFTAVQK